MICKPLDAPLSSTSAAFARGHIAACLEAAYPASEPIFVLNGLRLPVEGSSGGAFFDIDHLLIHKGGFILIDSSSLVADAQVSEQGLWVGKQGALMVELTSPVEANQKRIQALRQVLSAPANQAKLRGGLFGGKLNLAGKSFKPFVALAAGASLTRPKEDLFPEVVPGEALTGTLERYFASLAGFNSLVGSLRSTEQKPFSSDEMESIVEFLLGAHVPASFAAGPAPLRDPSPSPSEKSPKAFGSGSSNYYCYQCKAKVTKGIARYCFDNKHKFGGRVYCMEHQVTSKG